VVMQVLQLLMGQDLLQAYSCARCLQINISNAWKWRVFGGWYQQNFIINSMSGAMNMK